MKTNGVNVNNMRVSYLDDRRMIYLDLVLLSLQQLFLNSGGISSEEDV